MRIVFFDAVDFSLCALECLLSINADDVGVCTLRGVASGSKAAEVFELLRAYE